MARVYLPVKKDKKQEIKELAEADLEVFARLILPQRVYGGIHVELFRFWTKSDAKSHQLVLLPRDHGKSICLGIEGAWEIIRNPAIKILYLSSTANLAQKQLKFIKDILTSDIVRFYWPDLVNVDEGKREKWTESEISVDHPLRKFENVRDPTVFTAGLTTTITGLHADLILLDDVVVKENAYTADLRLKVEEQYSLLASIGHGDFRLKAVGTRYFPTDLYNTMMETTYEEYDTEGNEIARHHLFETLQREVEDRGDGTGQFLWPRQQRKDGKWFGFDMNILAKKRAGYFDQVQFRAQYYNDPQDRVGGAIQRDCFQYYDKAHLSRSNGYWYMRGRRLNVFAAIDFAYSTKTKADFTSIVVVGVDPDRNYYILEVDRFKAGKIPEYFKHLLQMHQKWDFRTIAAEITAAQKVIVDDLKDNYIRRHGLALTVKDQLPTRNEGTKAERIAAVLEDRYENRQIWHYRGGNCEVLEEELLLTNPPHDDCKDALASAIAVSVAPTISYHNPDEQLFRYHPRFGGII
jgi:phage terminase large subunit-like protein